MKVAVDSKGNVMYRIVDYDIKKNRIRDIVRAVKEVLKRGSVTCVELRIDKFPIMRYTQRICGDDLLNSQAVSIQTKSILDQPIRSLEFSHRVLRCLTQAHITTIGDLISKGEDELLSLAGFFHKSLDEVNYRLQGLGLSLRNKSIIF